MERTEVVVVGAGQAGVAMSEHLSRENLPHIVLERDRIAERWRTMRWDSLVANGPAWHDRFPGMEYTASGASEFPPKDDVAAYFEAYAEMIDAPIRCGVEVTSVEKLPNGPGFMVQTSQGAIEARNVVVATGPFQTPVIPGVVPDRAPVRQLHSNAYKNPQQLPDGGVLVVGGGASGAQIADELQRAGRDVYLSIGAHDRPPRAYRGRDYCWWLAVLGLWDVETPPAGAEHVAIAVSGAHGGHTVDFRKLSQQGITLLGMTDGYGKGVVRFRGDLADNIRRGDANYLSVLAAADEYADQQGLTLPEEPEAWDIEPDPDEMANPVLSLDLHAKGISTILWATGYAFDFSWVKVDAFDGAGKPAHKRGVSTVPGIYFVGLPWLSRRGSSFVWGAWHDAKFIADHISTAKRYMDHHRAQLKQE